MKTLKNIQAKIVLPLVLLTLTLAGCERDISDDVVPATFPTTAEIFTDAPVSLTDEFFISFDPAVGANTEGFGTDNDIVFEGNTSIRIDVPSPNDPDGNFIGGIFRDRGEGRDLSGYDALTFWARGSLPGTIQVGFGTDFITDTYPVSTNIQLTTGWRKYVIPIPDASVLVQERGMFLFSAGSFDTLGNDDVTNADSFTDNIGYSFWMDELRFENLGTTRLLAPFIFNGQDLAVENFTGFTQTVTGLGATYNLANGQNVSVTASSNYFDFASSDPSVATVTNSGEITTVGAGSATITGSIAGELGDGSFTINSLGSFINAPDPTQLQADVISIYSDAYTPAITGFDPGIFAGNIGTISGQTFDGNSHLSYGDVGTFPGTFGFVGIGYNGTVDVTGETMLHLDVQLRGGSGNLVVEIVDFGPDGSPDDGLTNVGGNGTAGGNNITSQLVEGQWVSIDIPLSAFTLGTGGGGFGNPNLGNIGFITFVSNGTSFLVDNIYFY